VAFSISSRNFFVRRRTPPATKVSPLKDYQRPSSPSIARGAPFSEPWVSSGSGKLPADLQNGRPPALLFPRNSVIMSAQSRRKCGSEELPEAIEAQNGYHFIVKAQNSPLPWLVIWLRLTSVRAGSFQSETYRNVGTGDQQDMDD